jgi:hypothetical protein
MIDLTFRDLLPGDLLLTVLLEHVETFLVLEVRGGLMTVLRTPSNKVHHIQSSSDTIEDMGWDHIIRGSEVK